MSNVVEMSSTNKPPTGTDGALANALRHYAGELSEIIGHIIQMQNAGEFALENFRDALVKANGVRLALDYEAQKLEERGAA